jgi:hypothetical protein
MSGPWQGHLPVGRAVPVTALTVISGDVSYLWCRREVETGAAGNESLQRERGEC